ncbi:MAG: helix-turn-helix domain-containing protein [Acidobacteria bacterium]|nr:helix-turn-helix domain-containing protein [Acidobacteriota bacterium]
MSHASDDHHLTIGKRIRATRRARRLTQHALARRTGLSEPFLSRIENGRAEPSLRTIERIARGLEVTIGDLIAAPPQAFRPPCPVTTSGRCIAELIYRPSRTLPFPSEGYTPKQIELLRLSNYLVQFGTPEALSALETVMRAMLKLRGTRRNAQWLRLLAQSRKGASLQ